MVTITERNVYYRSPLTVEEQALLHVLHLDNVSDIEAALKKMQSSLESTPDSELIKMVISGLLKKIHHLDLKAELRMTNHLH